MQGREIFVPKIKSQNLDVLNAIVHKPKIKEIELEVEKNLRGNDFSSDLLYIRI